MRPRLLPGHKALERRLRLHPLHGRQPVRIEVQLVPDRLQAAGKLFMINFVVRPVLGNA